MKMTESEHTEKLGNPALEIAFATVAPMMFFMLPETRNHVLWSRFLRDSLGAGLRENITASLAHPFIPSSRFFTSG